MAYNTQALIVDKNGKPIPQGYAPAIDGYKPVSVRQVGDTPEEWALNQVTWGWTGSLYLPIKVAPDGTQLVQLSGRNVVQAIEEALPTGANQIGSVKQGTAAAETAPWPVKQTDRISAAPVVGAKTVSTSAAELFAGASRLANRLSLSVYNDSTGIIYWGPSGVTTSTGYPLLPGDSVTFTFRPSTATPVFFIAGANSTVRVVELA